VLAAVLILGNVGFTDGPGVEVGVIGENELSSIATLLGVPPPALLRGLTSRTHNARGQLVKSVCDANMVLPSDFADEMEQWRATSQSCCASRSSLSRDPRRIANSHGRECPNLDSSKRKREILNLDSR